MIPTIGRIVHYMNLGDKDGKYPPEIQAALIVKITPDPFIPKFEDVGLPRPVDTRLEEDQVKVNLCIFYPTGMFWRENVPFSKEPARGHWFWPEIKK